MRKLAGFGLLTLFAIVAAAIWAKSPAVTKHADAVADPALAISPHELHLQIDIRSLPVQQAPDLI